MNKKTLQTLVLIILVSSVYRVIPDRPWGFAPQIAIALFSGSLFKADKKLAFLLPILSMFISDCLYQILYLNNLTPIAGFYDGQWINYLLFGGLTCLGFNLNPFKPKSILKSLILTPTVYFLSSNLWVWLGNGGYNRATLLQCYIDGLPFYFNSIIATFLFGTILFGFYNLFILGKLKYKNI